MSHHRKNSVREKVIGKKGIYLERKTGRAWAIPEGESGLERNILHRQSVGHLRR